MADATIDLLKSSFRQLRLPSMSREFERLARDAAATNQNSVDSETMGKRGFGG